MLTFLLTNSFFRRQILRAERRKEREILLQKYELEKIHEIRRQQSLNLRVGLRGLKSSRSGTHFLKFISSESSIFDEIDEQEMRRKLYFNDGHSRTTIRGNKCKKLQARHSNFPCCLENALTLLNKDIDSCDHPDQVVSHF